ncbi:hypothetical protein LTR28_005689 [Elasticomyces elasticus]|nr:hypothetical protein LTR28_005689 [Elasticomyces elasticus]
MQAPSIANTARTRERPPPLKRLILAEDGTWLDSDGSSLKGTLSIPSNVTRITRAIKARSSDGIPQIVYYHFGVGSQGSIVDRLYGGATGNGLAEIVREGYEFISTNYVPGDEIFLIGFSRGAFTARSIAGLIGEVGVLTKSGLPYLSEIFRDVQHMHDPNYVPKHRDIPFPNKPSAKDPRYRRELVRTLRQVWFPGVHSNVGGGYPDQQIGNITLAWMMSQLAPFIDFDPEYILNQDEDNERYYEKKGAPVRPWSFGKIYDSMSGLFALGGSLIRTPGTCYEIDPWTGRKTSKPLRDTHEYIHPSVRTRFCLKGPGVNDEGRYEAKALKDWKLMIEYDVGSKKPDVFWKARSAKRNATTRILPESPLWDMERELLENDPETYEYVMYPPQQQVRKKVRERPVDDGGYYESRQPRVRERPTRNEGYYED